MDTSANMVISVIMIAFVLTVGLIAYSMFHDSARTQSAFEISVAANETLNSTNGALATVPAAMSTDNTPVKDASFTVYIENASASFLLTQGTGYTITDIDAGINIIDELNNGSDKSVVAVYTYYGGTGQNAIEKVGTQTYAGFNLGSVIPLILFAVAIISIIAYAFVKQ